MIEFVRKNWDIICGAATGLLLTFLADCDIETVQLYYSIVILMLVCIGVFKILKQAIQGHKKERKKNIIDSIVDGQKSIKAISLAQSPTRYGEKIGEIILTLLGGVKKVMKKLKTFFDKFKGYMLTISLAALTIIEMCGAPINALFDGALTINGVEVLPVVTLAATAIVGILSNGFTKEQAEKIKALFSKTNTNELVIAEIRKSIKEKSAQLTQFNKLLSTQERELENLQSELETLKNTLEAKQAMFNMFPQLATEEEVKLAAVAVTECEERIKTKKADIAENTKAIENLTTTINALKSQL